MTAIAWLAVKESLRRRVWVALVVFGMILLFAAWFLKTDNLEPARLYLSFVLTATTYLILLLSLLLASFSLPNDFKSKTIYTIVTKPVRAGDVVLGRILGFTTVGTGLLVIMAIASWIFVTGSLAHTHTVDANKLESLRGPSGESFGQLGETSREVFHSHGFSIDTEGNGQTDPEHNHSHQITLSGDTIEVGPAEGYLRARVPEYGKLSFQDRKGVKTERGISVGNEWAYRSFIPGASQAAAIWTFEGIDDSNLEEYGEGQGKYLPIELLVRVYRSYIGDLEAQIQGSIQLRNPETGVKSSIRIFGASDDSMVTFDFATEQLDSDQNEISLLDDLVDDQGRVEVIVQCLDRAQYFGFAQADCFLRLPEASPLWNFVKGYLSIWMQMVIVISVAVTCSTLLSGPIAMVFTVAFLILSIFRDYFVEIALEKSYGGGPIESLVRMVTQMNQINPFEESTAVNFMLAVDNVLEDTMWGISRILPDFGAYLRRVDYVAEGFSIPGDAIASDLTVCLAYVAGMVVAGYFFFRSREAAK